jgi:hypothetical protein
MNGVFDTQAAGLIPKVGKAAAPMKRCSLCKRSKPTSAYYRSGTRRGRERRDHRCRSCRADLNRAWQRTESYRVWRRQYLACNTDKLRLWRWRDDLWKHRLTPDVLWRLIIEQRGECGVCGTSGVPLQIDHAHDETKLVRGLLCGRCNRQLEEWSGEDGPDGERVRAYLASPPAVRVLGEIRSHYRGGWARTRRERERVTLAASDTASKQGDGMNTGREAA